MSNSGKGILTLMIKEKNSLYASYMPFIKNGGLFIKTGKPYKLRDEVFLLLTLLDDKERLPVAGQVIWVTPPGSQGNRTAGIGIQLGDQDNGAVRNKIEGLLAGALQSDRPTHSM
ncbi:MAG: pilus assembly protein PilZ [Gammaproteobacteria bacterium]|nr:pilus assembly protein PilZ [Gammaproteobacteria bacterium]